MKTAPFTAFLFAALSFIPSARAVSAVAGDIILGFRATGGMGSNTCLEVNLGPASAFFNAAAGSTAILTRFSVEDLKDTYGDDWNTRADLFWGIAGTTGAAAVEGKPARTMWASRAEVTPGTASIPWPRSNQFTLNGPSQTISTLYTGAAGSIDHFGATTHSTFSSTVDAGLSGSWTYQETILAGVSFKYFNPSVMNGVATFPAANSSYDGTAYTVLDLWEVQVGATTDLATLVGGIGINSAGKLVFSKDVSKFGSSAPVELGSPTITLNPNGSVTITLAGVPPGNYDLERSTTMATALSWSTLFTQSPVSGGLSYTDGNPPQPRGFYRIKKVP